MICRICCHCRAKSCVYFTRSAATRQSDISLVASIVSSVVLGIISSVPTFLIGHYRNNLRGFAAISFSIQIGLSLIPRSSYHSPAAC